MSSNVSENLIERTMRSPNSVSFHRRARDYDSIFLFLAKRIVTCYSFFMIAFDLFCSNGHKFECWFKDSASFEEQKSAGILTCPICEDDQIEKAFSPFGIKKGGEEVKEEIDPHRALKLVSEFIEKHFEDVGAEFYKEALKMHYGEAEKKNIKGTATTEEEIILKEEGVQFLKIPIIKRLLN